MAFNQELGSTVTQTIYYILILHIFLMKELRKDETYNCLLSFLKIFKRDTTFLRYGLKHSVHSVMNVRNCQEV